MHSKEEMQAFLLEYIRRYPRLDVVDLIKLLYQSAFGCGHFAPDEARVLAYLREELKGTQADAQGVLIEPVLNRYARVHIAPYAARGMRSQTLAKLFMLTANEAPDAQADAWFGGGLDLLEEMAAGGLLPFDAQEVSSRLAAYRRAGCPSVHHSEGFRAAYRPAYRILRGDYAQLLDVFARIDALLEKKDRVLVAVDGCSGSGKSTLAALLAAVYPEMTLVHMDDFFLQAHQRTRERFETPGGNVDHERFLDEVLLPMRRGEGFVYRPFDCARMEIAEGKEIAPGRLCVAEGSYSLHPALESAYDLSLVLSIDPGAQAQRILRRNGQAMLERFVSEWIPMENRYFEATDIRSRGDLLIRVTPQNDGVRYDVTNREGRA